MLRSTSYERVLVLLVCCSVLAVLWLCRQPCREREVREALERPARGLSPKDRLVSICMDSRQYLEGRCHAEAIPIVCQSNISDSLFRQSTIASDEDLPPKCGNFELSLELVLMFPAQNSESQPQRTLSDRNLHHPPSNLC